MQNNFYDYELQPRVFFSSSSSFLLCKPLSVQSRSTIALRHEKTVICCGKRYAVVGTVLGSCGRFEKWSRSYPASSSNIVKLCSLGASAKAHVHFLTTTIKERRLCVCYTVPVRLNGYVGCMMESTTRRRDRMLRRRHCRSRLLSQYLHHAWMIFTDRFLFLLSLL